MARLTRRFVRTLGRDDGLKFRKALGQANRLVRLGVGEQNAIVRLLFELRYDLRERLFRIGQLDVVVMDVLLELRAEDRRHADLVAAGLDDAVAFGRTQIELEQPDIGRYEPARPAVVFRRGGQQIAGSQLQVLGAPADGGIIDRAQGFDGRLKLQLFLLAEAANQSSQIDAHDRPTVVSQLLDERRTPAEATLLIFEPGTAARFEIAELLAGDEDRQVRFLPALEDRAVHLDRIDFARLLRRVVGVGGLLDGRSGGGRSVLGHRDFGRGGSWRSRRLGSAGGSMAAGTCGAAAASGCGAAASFLGGEPLAGVRSQPASSNKLNNANQDSMRLHPMRLLTSFRP